MLTARTERMIYLRVLAPLLLAVLTLVIVSIGGFHALSVDRFVPVTCIPYIAARLAV